MVFESLHVPPDPDSDPVSAVPGAAVADAAPIALLVLELKTEVGRDGMLMLEALLQQSSPVWLQHQYPAPLAGQGSMK